MTFLVDGYNLLHATDLFGNDELAGTLQGSREALLDFLARRLSAKERKQSTIVFDASEAPPGLPDRYDYSGMHIRFARGYADADTLLEELIEACRAPKELTVVSGDRRVLRAARLRGAMRIESAKWYRELRTRKPRQSKQASSPQSTEAPPSPITAPDTKFWIEEFGDPGTLEEIEKDAQRAPAPRARKAKRSTQAGSQSPSKRAPSKRDSSKVRQSPKKSSAGKKNPTKPKRTKKPFGEGIFEGFPPGYADDLAQQLKPKDQSTDS